MLSFLVAGIMVSTALGLYGPTVTRESRDLVTGDIPKTDRNTPEDYRTASFGVKCFWTPDARLGVVDGVIRTRIGYLVVKNSSTGESGLKREVIRVDYNPEKISYQEIYEIVKDVSTLKRLNPLGKFKLADNFNQKYYLGQEENLSKAFQKVYPDPMKLMNSTAAARINGYLVGFGNLTSTSDLNGLGLTARGRRLVYDIWDSNKYRRRCNVP